MNDKNYSDLCCLIKPEAHCCKCKRKFCKKCIGFPDGEECPRNDRRRHGSRLGQPSFSPEHCLHLDETTT